MSKTTKRTMALLMAIAMMITLLPMQFAAAETSRSKVKKVTYYDKNPDPFADPSYADMPAVTVRYEDQSDSDDIDVMALKEVASEEEAENKDLGMKGYNIKGKWYKPIALWTMMPSQIVSKGEHIYEISSPLYFVGESKPAEGKELLIAIYDNKSATLGEGVIVKAPGEGGKSEAEEGGNCQHTGKKKYSKTNNKTHTVICAECGTMLGEEKHIIKTRKKKDGSTEQYCTKCEWHASQILKKPKLKKVKAGKKSMKVNWKKIKKADRKKIKKIAIQYSTSKEFGKGTKTKYVSSKKDGQTIGKLKSGKVYYVRIRAYTKSGKQINVSKWTKVKKVKVQ